MILQIITYETKSASIVEFKKSLAEMKKIYLNNGCIGYEIYQDQNNPDRYIETVHFENREAADKFEKLDIPEKRNAFNKFCSSGNVIGESVAVIAAERFI